MLVIICLDGWLLDGWWGELDTDGSRAGGGGPLKIGCHLDDGGGG